MTKRNNGEGTIRQRTDGRWEARLHEVKPNGERSRRSLFGRTKEEVRRKLREAMTRAENEQPLVDSSSTFAVWTAEWDQTILRASSRKETTKHLYRNLARMHLEPEPFGQLRLRDITPRKIDALILELRAKGLADSTVRNIYTVLRTILDGAVRDNLIATNPVLKVKRPSIAVREARHLAPHQVREVLAAAESSRYHGILAVIATTGLRRGEALGLRWEDVDLDERVIHVRRTLARVGGTLMVTEPKTANSRRTVPLIDSAAALLRRQRTEQKAERLRAGNRWHDTGYVFTTELGTPVEPRNLLRVLSSASGVAGIDGIGIHTLRHSAATAMLNAGVPLHVVSRVLGHSSVSITGDIYGHADDRTRRDAIDALGNAIGL